MRGRCFAMLALGLLKDSHPDVYKMLEARLDGSEVHLDVPVCALLTYGLIGDENKVEQLTGWLESGKIGREKTSDLERAWIVSALGKIGDPKALKAIRKTLRGKDRYTRRSAAIALGQIAPQAPKDEQVTIAKMLTRFHANEGDLTAKNFAVISLGRIGGDVRAAPEIRDSVKVYLKKSFRDANKATERPFVALAMGLLGFDSDADVAKSPAMKEELAAILRADLKELRGDKTALGAQAVALGMIGDRQSVKLLTGILKDRGEDRKLRGSAAIALGLIGDASANDAILATLREREDRTLRVDTAVAAGLLGDSRAVDELVKVLLHRRSSQFVLGSVALALGQVGDHRAIDPMLAILEPKSVNGSYPDLTRALVAVALGQLADRRDHRVLSQLSKDINYRANVPALDEILSIL
jgi:HEAT repeat protein